MGSESRFKLFVDIGSAVSKALLFDCESSGCHLVGRSEGLTFEKVDAVVEGLVSCLPRAVSKAERVLSISPKLEIDKRLVKDSFREKELLEEVVNRLSQDGSFLILEIGASKSWKVLGWEKNKKLEMWDYGVGKGARRVLRDIASEAKIARWLTRQVTFEEVGDYIGNKSIFPAQLPLEFFFLQIEQAVAREILAHLSNDVSSGWQRIERVVLSGAVLGSSIDLRQSMAIFLDGVAPEGICQVLVDKEGVLPFLGRVEGGYRALLVNLGPVISFTHHLSEGRVLGRIFLDLGLSEELEIIFKSGDLVRVPVVNGGPCRLRVELASGVEIKGFDPELKLEGGQLGVIFDARGRPLPKPELGERGRRKIKQWQQALK